MDALADAGARIFEITFDADGAVEDLVGVKARLAGRAGRALPGGCRHDPAARPAGGGPAGGGGLRRSRSLLDISLVDTAVSEDLPFIPGAFTPTEVAHRWAAGATFVMLYPAAAVGPSFVRELRGPLPESS